MTTRELEASHFHSIAQALVTEATNDQCEALKNLIFWRQRELKQKLVQQYKVGDKIRYYLADSKTTAEGTIHHLNKLSVSIHKGAGQYEAVPIERVISLSSLWRVEHTGEHGVELYEGPTRWMNPTQPYSPQGVDLPPLRVHPLDMRVDDANDPVDPGHDGDV